MAIFVKDAGVKVTVRSTLPEGASKFREYATDEAFVQELAAIAEDNEKFAYMQAVWNKTGRLQIRGNNGMADRVRAAAKEGVTTQDMSAKVASTPDPSNYDVDAVMKEAEARNRRIDAISKSNMPKTEKEEILKMLGAL